MRLWSKYQLAVFDNSLNGSGNTFVKAGPGSGKTTVIEEMVRSHIPANERVLAICFNKSIKEELARRFANQPNVTVDNFNGFGNKIIGANAGRGYRKVTKYKADDLLWFEVLGKSDRQWYMKNRGRVRKLISLCKSQMIFKPTFDQVVDLALTYGVSDEKLDEVFLRGIEPVMQLNWKNLKKLDFDDQLAMPLYFGWDIPGFDRVVVDESQDLNAIQIELAFRANRGRATFVGDPHQAIYQFRGADRHAVQSIVTRFQCNTLPLSVCYRCSKAVVRRAQQIYPDIEPAPGAPEGLVTTVNRLDAQPGDFVLCRTNAPLVRKCLELIAEGKKAAIRGSDLRDTMLDYLPETSKPINDFVEDLRRDFEPRISNLSQQGKEDKADALQDELDCLLAVAERCKTTAEMEQRLKAIFEEGEGILLSSVHRAKGLEAETVWILHPELIPHPRATDLEAEKNIEWVAVTRAKLNLYFVEG